MIVCVKGEKDMDFMFFDALNHSPVWLLIEVVVLVAAGVIAAIVLKKETATSEYIKKRRI